MSDCLVDYLRERTSESFKILVETTYRHVSMVAERYTWDRELAADVTQEVFLRLTRVSWRPEDVRSGMGRLTKLTKWISLTRRQEMLRDRRREASMGDATDPPAPAGPSLEDALDLRDALKQLPRELRIVVQLQLDYGLGSVEIARRLSVPQRTVQHWIREACNALRQRLSPPGFAWIVPILEAPRFTRPEVAPEVLRKLQAIVARHPRKPAPRARRTQAKAKPARRSQRRLVISAAAALVSLGLAIPVVVPQKPSDSQPIPVADAAPAPVTTAALPAANPVDRRTIPFRWNWPHPVALLRRIIDRALEVDWSGISQEPEDGPETAPVAGPDALCEVHVVDEEGEPVRTGIVRILRPWKPTDGEPTAGASSEGSGMYEAVLGRELSSENPAKAIVESERLGSDFIVRVAADGYPSVEKRGVALRPGLNRIEIVLPSRRVATVRVRNAVTGEPWGGARVVATPALDIDGRVPEDPAIVARECATGSYVIRGFGDGKHDLSVTSPRSLAVLREGVSLEGELTVWLHPCEARNQGTVLVRVFQIGGEPWAEAEVGARVGGKVISRVTGADGTCRFDDLPEGSHDFFLAAPPADGSTAFVAERRLLVRPGRERELSLGEPLASERLRVTVVDPAGGPRAGVALRLEGARYFEATTAARGEAVFDPIPAGEYQLAVESGAGVTQWVVCEPVVVRRGEENSRRLELGSAKIRGRIVSGAPAGLNVLAKGEGWLAAPKVGADGAFELLGARPGRYRLSTAGEVRGFVYRRETTVEVSAAGDPPAAEIQLGGLAILWVEVSDASGKPVRETSVECSGPGGAERLTRRSTGLRAREFAALVEPGVYRVRATAPDHAAQERKLRLEAGQEKRVEIRLEH